MKNKIILFNVAVLGSLICWTSIDFFIVELPIWKYLLIETLIVLSKMIYEKEKEKLIGN